MTPDDIMQLAKAHNFNKKFYNIFNELVEEIFTCDEKNIPMRSMNSKLIDAVDLLMQYEQEVIDNKV